MSLVEEKEYDLRFTSDEDAEFVGDLIRNPEIRQWMPPSSDEDAAIFAKNWVGFGRYKAALTAIYKGEPIGAVCLFLMPYRKVAHLAMIYAAVHPSFQRKGVGRSLIRNICHLGKTRFRLESVHFEVYEECPICPLLEELEFTEIIHQKNFVMFPTGLRSRSVYEREL